MLSPDNAPYIDTIFRPSSESESGIDLASRQPIKDLPPLLLDRNFYPKGSCTMLRIPADGTDMKLVSLGLLEASTCGGDNAPVSFPDLTDYFPTENVGGLDCQIMGAGLNNSKEPPVSAYVRFNIRFTEVRCFTNSKLKGTVRNGLSRNRHFPFTTIWGDVFIAKVTESADWSDGNPPDPSGNKTGNNKLKGLRYLSNFSTDDIPIFEMQLFLQESKQANRGSQFTFVNSHDPCIVRQYLIQDESPPATVEGVNTVDDEEFQQMQHQSRKQNQQRTTRAPDRNGCMKKENKRQHPNNSIQLFTQHQSQKQGKQRAVSLSEFMIASDDEEIQQMQQQSQKPGKQREAPTTDGINEAEHEEIHPTQPQSWKQGKQREARISEDMNAIEDEEPPQAQLSSRQQGKQPIQRTSDDNEESDDNPEIFTNQLDQIHTQICKVEYYHKDLYGTLESLTHPPRAGESNPPRPGPESQSNPSFHQKRTNRKNRRKPKARAETEAEAEVETIIVATPKAGVEEKAMTW